MRHHGAYSSSWRVQRGLGAGLPGARSSTQELVDCNLGISKYLLKLHVFIQSPSHSTRNSMLPCSSDRLCLMDFTPHSLSSALDFIRCFCKHIAVSVNTHYQDRIINMFHHSQTFTKFKLFRWKSQWEPCTSIQCACATHRLPVFKQSRKLPYVVFGMHFCSILSTVTNIAIKTQIVSSDFGTLVLLKYASWPDGL